MKAIPRLHPRASNRDRPGRSITLDDYKRSSYFVCMPARARAVKLITRPPENPSGASRFNCPPIVRRAAKSDFHLARRGINARARARGSGTAFRTHCRAPQGIGEDRGCGVRPR